MFLFLLMTAFALALIIGERKSHDRSATSWHPEPGSAWFLRNGALIVVLLVFVVITAALLYGHARVSRIYELTRSWDEIASMLPRPGSYFLMDPLPYWNQINAWIGASIPMRGEQNMFMGLGALGFCLAGIAGLVRGSEKAISIMPARAMLAAGIAIALLMTIFGSFSLYRIFALAAGFNAIRVGTRIILVLMFPVAVIAAVGLRALIDDFRPRAVGVSTALLLTLLTTYEIYAIVKPMFSAAEANRRTEVIVAEARSRAAGIGPPNFRRDRTGRDLVCRAARRHDGGPAIGLAYSKRLFRQFRARMDQHSKSNLRYGDAAIRHIRDLAKDTRSRTRPE